MIKYFGMYMKCQYKKDINILHNNNKKQKHLLFREQACVKVDVLTKIV